MVSFLMPPHVLCPLQKLERKSVYWSLNHDQFSGTPGHRVAFSDIYAPLITWSRLDQVPTDTSQLVLITMLAGRGWYCHHSPVPVITEYPKGEEQAFSDPGTMISVRPGSWPRNFARTITQRDRQDTLLLVSIVCTPNLYSPMHPRTYPRTYHTDRTIKENLFSQTPPLLLLCALPFLYHESKGGR